MSKITTQVRSSLDEHFSLVALKALIIVLAVLFVVLALCINNKWALAGVAAYMAFP